jgi:RpiB/LacA/LacB family sugar-phosphate isomerase
VKIFLSSDHAGVKLRARLAERLRQQGHQTIDLGPLTEDPCDYPDAAAAVGRAVRGEAGSAGVLVCGSGLGVCVAANKIRGVRAVAPWSVESARLSRAHNDANVICLGARLLPETDVEAILDVFLSTAFEGGRHARRVGKVAALEAEEVHSAVVEAERARLAAREVVQRIWAVDPRAFTPDPSHDKSIRNRLGWLRSPEEMVGKLEELESFAADAQQAGFRHAVLLGMGGSSLCPEVLAQTFPAGRGITLRVLDDTDPLAVRAVEEAIGAELERALFIVSSKSGGTIEVRSFGRYFFERVKAHRGGDGQRAGTQFVAITDPGTELDRMAQESGFRRVFRNPPDIGGRYSALSLFGLVPAALLGVDPGELLGRARKMAESCRRPALVENPAAALGSLLGALAKEGRDKLTLVMSQEIASFGSWVEQLVAESVGKLGKGIIPIDCEPLAAPALYGPDRVFVVMELAGGTPAAEPAALQALRAAGHPVVEIALADRLDLGAELFRWEFTTAVAGAALDINPFDEPNVTEAKQATAKLLETWARERKLPQVPATRPDDASALRAHLERAGRGDYLALCAFFHRTDRRHELLSRIRGVCRERRRVATTLGYGPRFLHSTGQLHKGGAPNGVFLQLVGETAPTTDLTIPGEPFTFGVLRDAQALGDFQVLQAHGRRALRVDLGADIEAGLERLLASLGPSTP